MSSLQTIDDDLLLYNNRIRSHPTMLRYYEDVRHGSISAVLGPPLSVLVQVPQTAYRTNRTYQALRPIEFRGVGAAYKGFRLADALAGPPPSTNLVGADEGFILSAQSAKITYRLQVEGHYALEKGCAAQRSDMVNSGIRRAVLIRHIATWLWELLNGNTDSWRLSNGDTVHFGDLLLLELRHVSHGSWQPVLGYFVGGRRQ